ncbi:hypothetical protein BDV12DRAFT_166875 [Aspergillus spectabilis]
MSTNPSIIFYQGLRCTKVRRKPRATDPPRPSTSSTSETSEEGPTSSRETSSSDRSTSNEDTTSVTATYIVAPATTTSSSTSGTEPSSSSQTAAQKSESHSSDLDISTSSNPSVTHTTFVTETTTTIQTTTPIYNPNPSTSDYESSGPPYAKIFGSLFGALLFIALVAIILFLFFRRRRSRQAPTAAGRWNNKQFRDDRASAGSRTSLRRDFKPETSYLSDVSPTSSILFKPVTKQYFDNPRHQTKSQPRYSDPFSDLAEVPNSHDPQSSIVPFVMRSFAMNPDTDAEYPSRPEESHVANRDSVHSGTSLGSTLVLPGRSSIGSDFHETSLSFPKPPETGHSYPRAVVRTNHTYSDPFDLCLDDTSSNKQISASRRSSGTIPVVLI